MKAILIFFVALTALSIVKGKDREEIRYCFAVIEVLNDSVEEIKFERIESCSATNETVKLQHRKRICGCSGAAHRLLQRISEGCYQRWETVPHQMIISVMSMYGRCLKKAKGNDKEENKSAELKRNETEIYERAVDLSVQRAIEESTSILIADDIPRKNHKRIKQKSAKPKATYFDVFPSTTDEEKFIKPINRIIENMNRDYKLENQLSARRKSDKVTSKPPEDFNLKILEAKKILTPGVKEPTLFVQVPDFKEAVKVTDEISNDSPPSSLAPSLDLQLPISSPDSRGVDSPVDFSYPEDKRTQNEPPQLVQLPDLSELIKEMDEISFESPSVEPEEVSVQVPSLNLEQPIPSIDSKDLETSSEIPSPEVEIPILGDFNVTAEVEHRTKTIDVEPKTSDVPASGNIVIHDKSSPYIRLLGIRKHTKKAKDGVSTEAPSFEQEKIPVLVPSLVFEQPVSITPTEIPFLELELENVVPEMPEVAENSTHQLSDVNKPIREMDEISTVAPSVEQEEVPILVPSLNLEQQIANSDSKDLETSTEIPSLEVEIPISNSEPKTSDGPASGNIVIHDKSSPYIRLLGIGKPIKHKKDKISTDVPPTMVLEQSTSSNESKELKESMRIPSLELQLPMFDEIKNQTLDAKVDDNNSTLNETKIESKLHIDPPSLELELPIVGQAKTNENEESTLIQSNIQLPALDLQLPFVFTKAPEIPKIREPSLFIELPYEKFSTVDYTETTDTPTTISPPEVETTISDRIDYTMNDEALKSMVFEESISTENPIVPEETTIL